MSGTNKAKDLGHLLLEEGLITEQQLEAARETQQRQEKSIGRVLLDMGADHRTGQARVFAQKISL